MSIKTITVERRYRGVPYHIEIGRRIVTLYVNRTKIASRKPLSGLNDSRYFYRDTETMLRECDRLIEYYKANKEVSKELGWVRDYLYSLMPQQLEDWLREELDRHLSS